MGTQASTTAKTLVLNFLATLSEDCIVQQIPKFSDAIYPSRFLMNGCQGKPNHIHLRGVNFKALRRVSFELQNLLSKNNPHITQFDVNFVLEKSLRQWACTSSKVDKDFLENMVSDLAQSIAYTKSYVVILPVLSLQVEDEITFRGIRFFRPNEEQHSKVLDWEAMDPIEKVDVQSATYAEIQIEGSHPTSAKLAAIALLGDVLSVTAYMTRIADPMGVAYLTPNLRVIQHTQNKWQTAVVLEHDPVINIPFSDSAPVLLNLNLFRRDYPAWFDALNTLSSQNNKKALYQSIEVALVWIGRSIDEPSDACRLAYLCFALESLVPIDSNGDLAFQLRLLASCLSKFKLLNRHETYSLLARVYTTRSKLVHGSAARVSGFELENLESIVYSLVRYYLMDPEGKDFASQTSEVFRGRLMEDLLKQD